MDAIAEYNSQTSDVEIVCEFIPWSDAYTKIQAGLQSGTAPDFIHADPTGYAALLKADLVMPLTDTVSKIGWTIPPNLRITKGDGNDYVIPTWIEILGLNYRRDWLAEVGLAGPFKSWDEVIAAAKAMTNPDKGRWGISMGLKREGKCGDDFLSLYTGFGGHLYAPDRTPAINNDLFKQTLEIMRRLCESAPPDAIEWEYAGTRTGYKTEKVGMNIYEGRTIIEILGEQNGGYGAGFPNLMDVTDWQLLPPLAASDWPKKAFVRSGIEGFSILKDSPNIAAANKFLIWLLGDRNRYVSMLATVPYMEIPVLDAIADDPSYWKNPAYQRRPDLIPKLQEAIRVAGDSALPNNYIDEYPDKHVVIPETAIAVASLALDDAVLGYVLEKKSADEVIATLQGTLADFVKE